MCSLAVLFFCADVEACVTNMNYSIKLQAEYHPCSDSPKSTDVLVRYVCCVLLDSTTLVRSAEVHSLGVGMILDCFFVFLLVSSFLKKRYARSFELF